MTRRRTMRAGDPRDLVLAVVQEHAAALLRTARRYSICADDANDAYQRAMEIFVRRAATLDPATAAGWIHTVVKHEALAVRRDRLRETGADEPELERHAASESTDVDERIGRFDRLGRAAEALQRLKPNEVRALWLKASGLSYAEIAELNSWTYTKVNRLLTEGRRAFLDRYQEIESGKECERWSSVLSAVADGEASAEQLVAARPHLRNCTACRATVRELRVATRDVRALLPAPAVGAGVAGDDAGLGERVAALLETAKEQLSGLLGRAGDSSAAAAQLAAGGRGTGSALAVKLATLCIGGATLTGGTYCVATGTLPDIAPSGAALEVSARSELRAGEEPSRRVDEELPPGTARATAPTAADGGATTSPGAADLRSRTTKRRATSAATAPQERREVGASGGAGTSPEEFGETSPSFEQESTEFSGGDVVAEDASSATETFEASRSPGAGVDSSDGKRSSGGGEFGGGFEGR